MDGKIIKTIDEYIAGFPPNVSDILQKLRQVVQQSAPGSQESISYGMPAFKLNGKYVAYFAAWRNHIGLYGVSSEVDYFKKELAPYEISKGTIKFPFNQPIPYALVEKLVKFKVSQELSKNE